MGREKCLEEIKNVQLYCKRKLPPGAYNYCFDHDLSLVLSKCSKVTQTHVRFTETTWNIFQIFTKRCRRFEDCIEQHNATPRQNEKLPKRIFRCFVKHYGCWEKHCT